MDLQLSDGKQRSALRVGQQILIAAPVRDERVFAGRVDPRFPSGTEKLAITGHFRRKKDCVAASFEERLHVAGRLALWKRTLPE